MSSHNESILREPLITGENITYAKITDDVLWPVENKPNKAWWIGFTVAAMFLGSKQNRRLGMGYYRLCMVGRYWSCWYSYFSGTFIVSPKLAKLD